MRWLRNKEECRVESETLAVPQCAVIETVHDGPEHGNDDNKVRRSWLGYEPSRWSYILGFYVIAIDS